ncbi:DOMON-like domain-containing protein [Bdellovibrionota bacterium FG-2]
MSKILNLIPFTQTFLTQNLSLKGSLQRTSDMLEVSFELCGNLNRLRITADSNSPSRLHELWKHTCFEAFFAPAGALRGPYWELNLSPSGDWNFYHFADYRKGMREALELTSIKTSIKPQNENQLTLKVELPADFLAGADFTASLTSVLEHSDGTFSYWALHHPTPKPDFHYREGFVVPLPKSR